MKLYSKIDMIERKPNCSIDAPILEPLVFDDVSGAGESSSHHFNQDLPCIMKKCIFSSASTKEMMSHIMHCHKIVVADVKVLVNLKGYLEYWKEKLTDETITSHCYGIKALVSRKGQNESEEDIFYMLSDTLPEDKELRVRLQQKRLEEIIQTVEQERNDRSFNRRCLFCNTVFTDNRSVLFEHLRAKHNLFLGNPDNIVFSTDFLDIIEDKLKKLQCLYCENIFKSRDVLLEHMRKKGHKQLNPDNNEYDKFYVINYTELGKTWQDLKEEKCGVGNYICHRTETEVRIVKDEEDQGELDNWSDWTEDVAPGLGAVCLFCELKFADASAFELHLKTSHNFDFLVLKKEMGFNFYQQVKLVNYIRRQIHHRKCMYCREEFPTNSDLKSHMDKEFHRQIPREAIWDQPEYFFPTYEDDSLLLFLDDEDCQTVNSCSTDVSVIAEEMSLPVESVLMNEALRKELNVS